MRGFHPKRCIPWRVALHISPNDGKTCWQCYVWNWLRLKVSRGNTSLLDLDNSHRAMWVSAPRAFFSFFSVVYLALVHKLFLAFVYLVTFHNLTTTIRNVVGSTEYSPRPSCLRAPLSGGSIWNRLRLKVSRGNTSLLDLDNSHRSMSPCIVHKLNYKQIFSALVCAE